MSELLAYPDNQNLLFCSVSRVGGGQSLCTRHNQWQHTDAMEVLALIPARGGSKSVPRKNIRALAGKPLIAHTIEQAKKSRQITRVVVSTDDPEIAEISRQFGAEVPFLRPADLAEDETPDWPVFNHALRWLQDHEKYEPDIVVHLRATTPNRRVETLDRAIADFIATPGIDSMRSLRPAEYSPYKMVLIRPDGCIEPVVIPPNCRNELWNMPRQALPQAYQGDGYVDITRPRVILDRKSMFGEKTRAYIIDESVVDIDYEEDLKKAEKMLDSKESR
jgi:CMP-N,N'-diacetyllegionaminic acid synthase